MFLSETHLDDYPAECLRRRLKMDSKIVNPSNGRSGGVIMFWKREINIDLLFSAPNYIDVRIVENPGKIWRLTGIYGEPRWEDKYKTWDTLRDLNNSSELPWVVLGDFNEILFHMKKREGISDLNLICKAFVMYFQSVLWRISDFLGTRLLGKEA
jgi:hypothetical protein